MSNILLLPQVPAFAYLVSVDGDWLDSIFFPANTLTPPNPLDLTGIRFRIDFRRTTDGQPMIQLDTNAGNLTNYGPTGFLAVNLPVASRTPLFPATCTGDVIAAADGYQLNLSELYGPLTLTVRGDTL